MSLFSKLSSQSNPEGVKELEHKIDHITQFASRPYFNKALNRLAPTALKFLSSKRYGLEYNNDLFVGDANTGTVYHFKLNANSDELQLDEGLEDKKANNNEELKKVTFATGFRRITDMEVGPDSLLYVPSVLST